MDWFMKARAVDGLLGLRKDDDIRDKLLWVSITPGGQRIHRLYSRRYVTAVHNFHQQNQELSIAEAIEQFATTAEARQIGRDERQRLVTHLREPSRKELGVRLLVQIFNVDDNTIKRWAKGRFEKIHDNYYTVDSVVTSFAWNGPGD